jgi:hypothetical protein
MFSYKLLSAICAAALAAAAVIVLPGVSPEVEARTPAPAVKGDRLDAPLTGAACSEQAWPYYEPSCLRDRNRPHAQPRTVRVVTTDRIAR